MENIKKDIKDLEVKIEKFPLAQSPFLIEEFLIMGYSDEIKKEKIINYIKTENLTKKKKDSDYPKSFTIEHLPTVISAITSNSGLTVIDFDTLIGYTFPIPPEIFYSNKEENMNITKIVFNNINNNTINIGYAYSFYEKEIFKLDSSAKENIIVYYPKAFVIISQYNYFYAFHKICENLHNQLLNNNIEIPIEIQIYNIVNFTPCPLEQKIELIPFPLSDLSSILKCKSLEEYKNLNKNACNIINLEQLGGYKHSEINFCKILDILTPELIVQVYFQLFCGKTIAFFSRNKETLHLVLLIFTHFLFPLSEKENCYSFNPNYYYSAEFVNSFIVGYLSEFKNLDKFDPTQKLSENKYNFLIFEDEKSAEKDRRGFEKVKLKCDFILDIEEKKFEMYEEIQKGKEKENEKESEDKKADVHSDDDYSDGETDEKTKQQKQIETQRIKFLYDYINKLVNDKSEGNDEVILDSLVKELNNLLKSYSIIIKDKKLTSFFVENEEEKKVSEKLQGAFLRLNLLLCDDFFNRFSAYNGGLKIEKILTKKTKEELNISEAEFYFFDNFQHSPNWDILMNMAGRYNPDEPIFPKATKRGFDNLLACLKESKQNDYILKEYYIPLLDSIFRNKKEEKVLHLSFLEFYKHYNMKLKNIIASITDDKIIEKKVVKKDNDNKYIYSYKKIAFDRKILLNYCYYLEDLDNSEKAKLFSLSNNMESIEKIIHTIDYYNAYEDFLITNSILQLKNIIKYCILNIVILSIPELKMVHFSEPIYELIKGLNFGCRKYAELILNASFRYFVNKGSNTNKNEAKKYFDIYNIAIEEKKIFPNDELIVIENEILKYLDTITNNDEIKESDLITIIKKRTEKELFTLQPDNADKNEILKNAQKQGKSTVKISLNSDLITDLKINVDSVYYPYTLYYKMNEVMEKYYTGLQMTNQDKIEYKKLIVNVIYYLRAIKENFHSSTLQFLFYCLCEDKKQQ